MRITLNYFPQSPSIPPKFQL